MSTLTLKNLSELRPEIRRQIASRDDRSQRERDDRSQRERAEHAPPALKAKPGAYPTPPSDQVAIYAAINATQAGTYISIYSLKARVWVRLLNRFMSHQHALDAIDTYGFVLCTMPVPPHARDLRRKS